MFDCEREPPAPHATSAVRRPQEHVMCTMTLQAISGHWEVGWQGAAQVWEQWRRGAPHCWPQEEEEEPVSQGGR